MTFILKDRCIESAKWHIYKERHPRNEDFPICLQYSGFKIHFPEEVLTVVKEALYSFAYVIDLKNYPSRFEMVKK